MFFEEIIGAFTGENRRTRHRQVCAATLFGLLAGAAAGILFAPLSGKDTRELIAKETVKGAHLVKDASIKAGSKIKETATDLYGTVSEKVSQFTAHAKAEAEDVVDDAAKKAREAARAARQKARSGIHDAAEAVEEKAHEIKEDVQE